MAETLSSAEMAAQLAKPEGEIGVRVGLQMNAINATLYADCETHLAMAAGQRLLEVGFANGHFIPELLRLAADVSYCGIDISDTMVAEASAFNRSAVEAGRVRLCVASVEAIPFADAGFDRVLAVNTIYFWPDATGGLSEIRRVLKPGGRLVLAATAPDSASKFADFNRNFLHYDADSLRRMLAAAGFLHVDIDRHLETMSAFAGGPARARESYIVAATA